MNPRCTPKPPVSSPSLRRRGLLQGLAALAATPWAGLSLAGQGDASRKRFVFFILRGGMDGLYTVPALGDPDFAAARGSLGQYEQAALPLQGPFALHPLLKESHAMYQRGELAVVHAVGLPYHERSHFDAQQVLESGGTQPFELKTGWLGRALTASGHKGLALATAVPLVLRGATAVDTWAPSELPDPSTDLLQRLELVYAQDAMLAPALQRARALRDGGMGEARMDGARQPQMAALAAKAGEFLAQARGPQVAVLDMGGWDSHAGQDAPRGKTADAVRQLDAALAALRIALTSPAAAGAWERTVVVVATEFGRTVEINGTHGSDHGNGSAALVLGGAVKGGRVLADWPGLAKSQRYMGRDLAITTDLRAILKGMLADHLQVASAALDREVFPGSAAIKPLGLLRG